MVQTTFRNIAVLQVYATHGCLETHPELVWRGAKPPFTKLSGLGDLLPEDRRQPFAALYVIVCSGLRAGLIEVAATIVGKTMPLDGLLLGVLGHPAGLTIAFSSDWRCTLPKRRG